MKKVLILFVFLFANLSVFAQDNKATADRVKIDADQNFLILSTKKIETMEKELDEVAGKGFRVLYGAPTVTYDMALFLERLDTPEKPRAYKILATSRIKTMEKELNDLAAKGFRLLPRTIVFKQGLFTAEIVTVLEREPDSPTTYEYKLVAAGKEVKLQSKIDEARTGGFAPVTMITLGENVVVMEKISTLKL